MALKADSQTRHNGPEVLAERAATRLDRSVAAVRPVAGGYSAAQRILVRWRDGDSAFIKGATDADTAAWLRAEYAIYSRGRAPFMPELLGWEDDGVAPWLAIEDLSTAIWPPPWSPASVDAVLATLRDVAATPASDLASYENYREDFAGWSLVAADPEQFLGLGVATERWLDRALPTLIDAERRAVLDGDALLHNDVRSDNLCFAGERVVLVDWNWASRGNPKVDIAAWLPSLAMEGGPTPESLLPEEPELASFVAGFYAAHAGLPPPRDMRAIRELQLAMLRESLAWASRALDLATPDGRSGASNPQTGI
jgi:hypothetical protein